jgi:3-phenylpropionate/cinnamic acid dioxygenase small subunit
MNEGALRRNLPPAAELRELRLEIDEFNAEYAYVLDEGDLETWPDFFTSDGLYRITARENADAGLPIGLIYCDGRGMLIDRIRAVMKTTSHEPRYLRHFCSNVRILAIESSGLVQARSNYLVAETLMEGDTRIFQSGRYEDTFARQNGRLLLKARHCVYDTLTITNALVYPV